MKLKIGSTYKVQHSRKGTFTMRVTDVEDVFVHGVVVAGRAGAIMEYNERDPGEAISVRIEFCKFTEQKP